MMGKTSSTYDRGIAYIRVLAMFMILICHIANQLNVGIIAQLFQVGVQIFLLISGYLCAMKIPESSIKWLIKRVKRIFIPIWLFAVVILLIFTWSDIDILFDILPATVGIYGISHIFTFLSFPSVKGFEHLWYITPLLISYLLMVLIYKRRERINKFALFFGTILLQLLLAFFAIRIDFIVVFLVGYILFLVTEKTQKMVMCWSNIGAGVFIVTRIVMSRSDTLSNGLIYLFYVIPLCYNFLAVAFFCDIKWVLEKIKPWRVRWIDKIVVHIDTISYEVYIVHYIFITGIASVYDVINQPAVSTVVFLIITFIVAECLHFTTKMIDRTK